MTFNDDADIRGGRVSRRGRNVAIGAGVGGGGLAVVAVLLIGQLLGVDLSGVVPTTGAAPASSATALSQCTTGAEANQDVDCRMQAAATSLDAYWTSVIGSKYTQPQIALFDGATTTACGEATADIGPFYCPDDQTVYVDTAFYDELKSRFGASGGDLAQLYVVAHEWGHHIQNLVGIMDGLDLQASGPSSDSVRLELQADCFAGAWVAGASHTLDKHGTPFLNAAAAVGDDHIQSTLGDGRVNPETFTHGTSAQRDRWFSEGYTEQTNGKVACDTFGATARNL
jgi:predicted metalloprotease